MNYLTKIVSRYSLLWIFLLFAILPFLAFPEIVFGGQTLYRTDLSWIHFPRHIFAAEEWLAGRVPLWDPYEHTGVPLLAESQVGVLYPFSVLFLSWLSPALELSLFILIHFTLAALFTFILTRSLALSRAAATVAGLSFGLGGFLMAQVPNLNIMTGAVWLPLILYAAIQTTRRRSWLAAMLGGIPLALQILTAQPQIVFYTLVTLGGYGLYRIGTDLGNDRGRADKVRQAARTGLQLGLLILSGLLLAAPQLLPTLELQQLSVRSQARNFGFLTENSLPPVMWLNLLLPGLFGNSVTGFRGGDPFQEDFIYAGFIPLALLFFSWAQRQKRDMLFFYFLLVGGALLAMGRFTPLYEYGIQYLPGFALFRIPARWLMVVNLALAVLAGAGLETLLARGLKRSTWTGLLLIGLTLGVGLLVIWLFKTEGLRWSSQLDEPYRKLITAFLDRSFYLNPLYQERLLPGWLAWLRVPALLLMANIAVMVVWLGLYAARRISAPSLAVGLILAISIDLTVAGGTTINKIRPAEWWWQLSGGAEYVLEHVGDSRVFPLGMGSEELTVSHLGQYFPSVYRVYSAGGHGSSLLIDRYTTFLHEAHPVQSLRVVGVRYLLSVGQMGADVAATYPLVYHDDNSIVYENKDPLPRAFIVHQAIQAGDSTGALAYFQGLEIDPRHTVILEGRPGPPELSGPTPSKPGQAAILRENPQMIEIETRLAKAGYLVLLDSYYPGWKALVNGKETPVYRANSIGRAVFLPAGEHIVRFQYQPLSFQVGLWLSLIMILSLAITALTQ